MKQKFLIFVILLFLPFITMAASVKVILECPAKAALNATIQCDVKINSDVDVTGVAANYKFNNNFSYVSFSSTNNFSVYNSSSNGFAIGNTSGKKGTFKVGTLKLKFLNAGSFSLTNLDISDSAYNSYSPTSVSPSVKVSSTTNTLSDLTISSGKISPSFSTETLNYKVEVDVDTITISATKTDATSTVTGIGKKNIKYGENKFNIVVTSESGTKRTYTLIVTRKDERSSDNNLKSLSISDAKINFSSSQTNYKVTVPNTVDKITVSAQLNDSKANFVSQFGPRTVELKTGENEILIRIKAENETVKTYTIKVTKSARTLSSNCNIKELSIANKELKFQNDKYNYKIKLIDETELVFNILLEDEYATYEIKDNENLDNGSIVTITVTSESGMAKNYYFEMSKGFSFEEKHLYFIIGFVAGTLITLIFAIIILKNKNKKFLQSNISNTNENTMNNNYQNNQNGYYQNNGQNEYLNFNDNQ